MPRWAGNRQSPIDDQIAEADIADRLRMANALRDKSMVGAQLENVGGHLIGNPYARALTGVVQGFEGGQERKKAYGMAEDLAASKRDRLAKALAGAGQEPTPEARLKRGTELMGDPDPQAQEVGRYMAESAQKEIARREEAQQKQYGETNKDLRNMKTLLGNQDLAAQKAKNDRELAEWKFNHPTPSTAQPHLPARELQLEAKMREIDQIPDPALREQRRNELYSFMRAQQVVDLGDQKAVLAPGAAPGTPAASLPVNLAPNQTPQHAFDVAGAKKQGEAAAGLASQKARAPGVIGDAEALLDPAQAEQMPTQSGIGSVADRVASVFGITLAGAKEADKLRTLGGHLTSMVPRFEGPQGVRDVEIYQEMAGRVGDDTLPADRRLAALKQVEEVIMRNGGPAKVFGSGGAPMAPPAEAPPPAGIDPEDWKYLSPEERAAFGQ